ncbi:MAG: class I SAM-dependent methyltransferase [Bacteroidota bacterium]
MQLAKEKILSVYHFCKTECSDLERWPSYFHRRALEMQSYLELMPDTSGMNVLELGCGIGYQSAMLGMVCNKVYATDLPNESTFDHAPGMKVAIQLLDKLHVHNVEFVPCSAENLPFEDSSMDMVFSSHVLEHIPNQQKALHEIYRVLKPGGVHVCIVPVRFEKMYSFISYYSYLMKSVLKRIINVFGSTKNQEVSKSNLSNIPNEKLNVLKDFPFPPPHGYANHFLSECNQWSCANWQRKMKMDGLFDLKHHSTTQINPLLPLLGPLFPNLSANVHRLTRKFELHLGQWPVLRTLGINTVMIATSNKPFSNAK